MCCLTSCCFSAVVSPRGMGTGCGYVCGCRNTYHVATAYGGDINCPGTYSCVGQWHCDTRGNRPYMNNSLAKPHGQMVSEIATAMVSEDQGTTMGNRQSGHGPSNHQKGQGSINRSSGAGMNSVGACWLRKVIVRVTKHGHVYRLFHQLTDRHILKGVLM